MFWQFIAYACNVAVYFVVHGADLECLFVDFVYGEASASHSRPRVCSMVCDCRGRRCVWEVQGVHITANGSFARLVPRRNFRSLVLVASEIV
jgi:hypothetical protein